MAGKEQLKTAAVVAGREKLENVMDAIREAGYRILSDNARAIGKDGKIVTDFNGLFSVGERISLGMMPMFGSSVETTKTITYFILDKDKKTIGKVVADLEFKHVYALNKGDPHILATISLKEGKEYDALAKKIREAATEEQKKAKNVR